MLSSSTKHYYCPLCHNPVFVLSRPVGKGGFNGCLSGVMEGSLRSKRFLAVSEQRKTEERDSRFWPREK